MRPGRRRRRGRRRAGRVGCGDDGACQGYVCRLPALARSGAAGRDGSSQHADLSRVRRCHRRPDRSATHCSRAARAARRTRPESRSSAGRLPAPQKPPAPSSASTTSLGTTPTTGDVDTAPAGGSGTNASACAFVARVRVLCPPDRRQPPRPGMRLAPADAALLPLNRGSGAGDRDGPGVVPPTGRPPRSRFAPLARWPANRTAPGISTTLGRDTAA